MRANVATISANGEPRQIQLPLTLGEFLEKCGWRPSQVVVELNGEVLPRKEAASRQLQDGDRVEIIVPVAGG